MSSKFYRIFVFTLILAGFQVVSAQYTGTMVAVEPADVTTIYNNGGITTGATSKSGVAAPAGFVWSELQNDTGNTTESNTSLGFGGQFGANRLVDNFTVPAGQTWRVSSVSIYAYRTGWAGTNSPFVGATLRIWDARPSDAGANMIFGDLTTNRLLSSTATNIYRVSNSQVPAPGTVPGTTRLVWENRISVAPTLTLGPGTYWIDFDLGNFDNNTTSQFVPSVTVANQRGVAGANARQFQVAANTWVDLIDGGNPATAPDVLQEIPFLINGTVAAPRNASKFMDFDGDGKTDFAVLRWGIGPADPTTWHILTNSASPAYSVATFGVRAGTGPFTGTLTLDRVMPEDYDGDGKTDIAVYDGARATTAAPATFFWILNSSDNTLRQEQFGTRLDVGTIMGDYDGDGKADLAIWRRGATAGAQSTFWVKKSSNGEAMAVDWGVREDRPVLGDYDGDGKQDFSVLRVNTSNNDAVLYTLQSSGGIKITPFNYPFGFVVPGDYDGDGKTDIATIRSVLNNMVWTIQRSSDDRIETINCGIYSTDFPAQGDYNGDGRTDLAIWRKTATGSANPTVFWVRRDDGSFAVVPWGNGNDAGAVAGIRAY